MKSHTTIHILLAVLTFILIPNHAFSQTSEASKKLNVLLIISDDINCAIGCYGNPIIKTPNIDKLASRGVRFDHAYCQYPLCNPSRTSFLSGLSPESTHVWDQKTNPRDKLKEMVFLPEYFKQNGYFTARMGKIANESFEKVIQWDVTPENHAQATTAKDTSTKPKKNWLDLSNEERAAEHLHWEAPDENDDQFWDGKTSRTISQILEENQNKPFFIGCGFKQPHIPFICPKKYFIYPVDKIPDPPTPLNTYVEGVPLAAYPWSFRDQKKNHPLSPEENRQLVAAYYANITFVDAQVGIVMDTLDRLNLANKTIVVFMSDHGYHNGDHGGIWDKMSLFEESLQVPLIIVAPGTKSGGVSKSLVEYTDLYPTLTELCGLKKPEWLQGKSLAPLLDDPTKIIHEAAFSLVERDSKTVGRSVRTQRFRYNEWGDSKGAELYDFETDPNELKNLAQNPDFSKQVTEMHDLLIRNMSLGQDSKTSN
jgi:iduronate 2-sulfatase